MNHVPNFKIFIINLKSNKKRWNFMVGQMKKNKIDYYERVDGYKGWDIEDDPEILSKVHPNALMSARRGYRITHDEHNYGSIGCYISHTRAWQNVIDSGHDFGIILEDDAFLCENFVEKLMDVIQAAPLGWDFLNFGRTKTLGPHTKRIHKNGYEYNMAPWIYLAGYVIKRSLCKSFLQTVFPIEIQIDWWVSDQQDIHKIWFLKPFLTGNSYYTLRSDIKHSPVIREYRESDMVMYTKIDINSLSQKKHNAETKSQKTARITVLTIITLLISSIIISVVGIAIYRIVKHGHHHHTH